MKKAISLLLALMLCLSLCACGGSNEMPEAQVSTDPATTPEATEPATTEATEPEESEPAPVCVEITLENWQDYFELREYTEFVENGFGEIDDAKTHWSVVSKDGYTVDEENCDVTFEFTYDEESVVATINTETKTVVYGEATGSSTSEPVVETMNNVGQYIGEYTHDRYGEYLTSEFFDLEDAQLVSVFDRRVVNVTVLRISGTFSYFE